MNKLSKLGVVASSVLFAATLTVPAFAHEPTDTNSSDNKTSTVTTLRHDVDKTTISHETSVKTDTDVSDDKTSEDHHFTGDKLRICKLRHAKIDGAMGRLTYRGQKQLDLFTKIATRVETFYTASGKTLDNYDELVAAINTQKDVTQQAVDKVKADRADFKCDGTNPAGTAEAFKADLKQEIQALKDYRTSVKNLIVAVKGLFPEHTTTKPAEGSN